MRGFSHMGGRLGRTVIVAAAVCGLCVTLGAGAGRAERAAAAQAGAGPEKKGSVWDGVYTEAQAQRGQARYQRLCMSCHHGELQGDKDIGAPALAGDAFFTNWNDLTVEMLFDKIFRTMPFEEPETLNPQDTIDLVAYILQVNKLPSGEVELAAEPARLGRILIEKTPPASSEVKGPIQ